MNHEKRIRYDWRTQVRRRSCARLASSSSEEIVEEYRGYEPLWLGQVLSGRSEGDQTGR